jgi:hypothetical protein
MSEFANVTASSVADVPRLDYSGGSCPSLLLEPQRSNYFEFSDDYSQTVWNKAFLSLVSNAATSPDGYQNADKLYPNTSTSFAYLYNISTTSSSVHTLSVYVKANGKSKVWAYIESSASYGIVYYDLTDQSTQVQAGSTSTPSGTITAVGNDWYRITFTTGSALAVSSGSGIGICDAKGNTYITASGTDGILVYGFQLEQGSYSTSLIPTYGTTVTRLADKAYKTGISSLIGSDAGTIYLEASALANDLSERRFALSDGTTANVARVGFTNVSNRILAVLYNGSNQCVLTYTTDITQTNKIAFTWAANDFALFVNGAKRSSDVSGTTFPSNTLNSLHFNEGDGLGNEIEGRFDKVLLFTSRLSDTELENLTA